MDSFLFKNAVVWDGINDASYAGEVLVEGNRIKTVTKGANQISSENAAEIIDAKGMTLMPGMVEGHCHLSFVNPSRNQDLGEIPPEEHLLRTCRNATFILDHGFTSCYSAASAKMRIDVVVRQEIEDGYLAGPRYKAAGPEITTTGGLGDERKAHMHAESFGMIADGVDEIIDGPRKFVVGVDVLDGRFHRAALAVTENNNEAHTELGNGVFNASLHGSSAATDDIASNPDDEKIANTLIEE
jgi:imidazolonepropionase-like amidohydrolase